jgi:hypothetical protein
MGWAFLRDTSCPLWLRGEGYQRVNFSEMVRPRTNQSRILLLHDPRSLIRAPCLFARSVTTPCDCNHSLFSIPKVL